MPIKNPHDRLFRKSLSNKEIAKEFLSTYVPLHILAKFNMDTITICKTSFIDPKLQEKLSDIVYSAKLLDGSTGYLYFLLEHQSTADRLIPLRILQYQVAIINQHMEQHPNDKLPIVYSMLYYCGTDKPYPYTLNVLELFNDCVFAEQTLGKPAHLIDVTVMPDEIIMQHKLIGLLELVHKHINDEDLTLIVGQLKQLILNIIKHHGFNSRLMLYVKVNLYYIMQFGNINNPDRFIEQLEENITIKEQIMGTLARTFIDEGVEKGIGEGEMKKAKATALVLLQKGIDHSIITESTGLSEEELAKIKAETNN